MYRTAIVLICAVFLATSAIADSINSRVTSNGTAHPNGIDYANTPNMDEAVHTQLNSVGVDADIYGDDSCKGYIDDDITKYKINSCKYYINGKSYVFATISGLDPNFLPSQNSAYIALLPFGPGTGRSTVFDAITSTGPVRYSTEPEKNLVTIARFNSPLGQGGLGSDIKLIRDDRDKITPYGHTIFSYIQEVLGAQYVTGGEVFSNNTALNLGQREGILYDGHGNRHVLSAFNTITAVFVHYSSNGDYAEDRRRLIVDNLRCGDGSNTGLEDMLPNRWCNNKLLKSPKGANGVQEGGIFYIYGSQSYGTQVAASAEEFSFGLFIDEFTSGLTPWAEVIIEQGSTTPILDDRRKCLGCVR
jgi:hypothetical protein